MIFKIVIPHLGVTESSTVLTHVQDNQFPGAQRALGP